MQQTLPWLGGKNTAGYTLKCTRTHRTHTPSYQLSHQHMHIKCDLFISTPAATSAITLYNAAAYLDKHKAPKEH